MITTDDEILGLNASIKELTEGLRALADVQNGPPLCKYKDEWNDAIKEAYRLLAIYDPIPEGGR